MCDLFKFPLKSLLYSFESVMTQFRFINLAPYFVQLIKLHGKYLLSKQKRIMFVHGAGFFFKSC